MSRKKQTVWAWVVLLGCSPETVPQQTLEFSYPAPVLRDTDHALTKISRACVTPEAAVFLPGAELIYHTTTRAVSEQTSNQG